MRQLAGELSQFIDAAIPELLPRVIAWRRDLHRYPELSNREHRTAGVVAEQLRRLGLAPREGVAHTGVVADLVPHRDQTTVALRADMDALPVAEEVDLPFASRERGVFDGQDVGIMHACGHDGHTAILLGVAELLTGLGERLPGNVRFIFQPAEEGPPRGEAGGAKLMVHEGVLQDPVPSAIFGLHLIAGIEVGRILYRAGPTMASGDLLHITVRGSQTHGALPWRGVDPIVVGAQIVLALQTVVSRQIDLTLEPAIVTIGCMHGGVRSNIIPDRIKMIGTIRTFDEAMRHDIHQRVRRTVEKIAESAGASAVVEIESMYDVTVNDVALTEQMAPILQRSIGADRVRIGPKLTGSEDFSVFQQHVPGFFYFVGCTPPNTDPAHAAPNHSPRFFVDEAALEIGLRSMASAAVEYLCARV